MRVSYADETQEITLHSDGNPDDAHDLAWLLGCLLIKVDPPRLCQVVATLVAQQLAEDANPGGACVGAAEAWEMMGVWASRLLDAWKAADEKLDEFIKQRENECSSSTGSTTS